MKVICAFLICFVPALLFADTTWVQPGPVQGNWAVEHSPYMIGGNIQIMPDDTLYIGPGVECNFTDTFTLTVGGMLVARGTLQDSILFTRNPSDSTHGWRGVSFMATSSAEIDYCIFRRMYTTTPPSGLFISAPLIGFHHTSIRDNRGQAVNVNSNCGIVLDHCDLVRNGRRPGESASGPALHLNTNSIATATDCFFGYNGALDGGAIHARSGVQLMLDRCIFKNNTAGVWGGAIFGETIQLSAVRCTFVGNRGADGSHINLHLPQSMSLNSCIFAFGRNALGAISYGGGVLAQVENCAFFGNNTNFQNGSGDPVGFEIINRLNRAGTPCDIYANIFLDPMFADTSGDSLNLLVGSPCVDAGDSALLWDPDGSPPDIGAVPLLNHWNTIQFVGGFSMLGCPCENPMGLNEGSLVRLRQDAAHDGITPDDAVVSQFAVSAGAGLPPWNGYWEPRPDSGLTVDSFYVEVMAGVCCWNTGLLHVDSLLDTVVVEPSSWSCFGGSPESVCGGAGTNTVAQPRGFGPAPSVRLAISPNPFNANATIQFAIASTQEVDLTVFDLQGRRVASLAHGAYESGVHRVEFDGSSYSTGIYFVRLQLGASVHTQKILLLK